MNALFEGYVARQIRHVPGTTIRAQAQQVFWRGGAVTKTLKPDLIVTLAGESEPLILDTKWKVPSEGRPADDDLRQLFAYLRTFGARRGLLLYPGAGAEQVSTSGTYADDSLVGGLAFVDILPNGEPNPSWVREELGRIVHQGVSRAAPARS